MCFIIYFSLFLLLKIGFLLLQYILIIASPSLSSLQFLPTSLPLRILCCLSLEKSRLVNQNCFNVSHILSCFISICRYSCWCWYPVSWSPPPDDIIRPTFMPQTNAEAAYPFSHWWRVMPGRYPFRSVWQGSSLERLALLAGGRDMRRLGGHVFSR